MVRNRPARKPRPAAAKILTSTANRKRSFKLLKLLESKDRNKLRSQANIHITACEVLDSIA
ncbi:MULTISPECIES: hypothetical protein [unclassified Nostoc]|uniref:hypothetical protein n=1 Tax=unclassified Nostoc TaxID=2593658 RepID=UPI002AD3879A|nr:hypothetical protein [Nostoc sp. DedQUE03]MDZ7971167.1 hypothetical protein [Nostoc sp. DedQUE03]MDZ8046584.1 hypothetical protein [Nostoc sp. DedQUE02]